MESSHRPWRLTHNQITACRIGATFPGEEKAVTYADPEKPLRCTDPPEIAVPRKRTYSPPRTGAAGNRSLGLGAHDDARDLDVTSPCRPGVGGAFCSCYASSGSLQRSLLAPRLALLDRHPEKRSPVVGMASRVLFTLCGAWMLHQGGETGGQALSKEPPADVIDIADRRDPTLRRIRLPRGSGSTSGAVSGPFRKIIITSWERGHPSTGAPIP